MLLVEVISDDKRRCHVNETGSDAVEQTVSEEEPFEVLNERRSEAADAQDDRSDESSDPIATVTQKANETHRQRS